MYKYLVAKTSETGRPLLCWVENDKARVVHTGNVYSRRLLKELEATYSIDSYEQFIETLEFLANPLYWREDIGSLEWVGESPNGNEIVHEDAREMALAVLQYVVTLPLAPYNELEPKKVRPRDIVNALLAFSASSIPEGLSMEELLDESSEMDWTPMQYLKEVWGYERLQDVDEMTWECIEENAPEYTLDRDLIQMRDQDRANNLFGDPVTDAG